MKNKKDLDSMEELFRSKLYDFEVDTMPDDWDKIEARLSTRKIVPFYRKPVYWAAAVAILFMVTGTLFILDQQPEVRQIAQTIESVQKEITPILAKDMKAEAPITKEETVDMSVSTDLYESAAMFAYVDMDDSDIQLQPVQIEQDEVEVVAEPMVEDQQTTVYRTRSLEKRGQNSSEKVKKEKKKNRRWQFGMGGGSLSTGTSNSINTYAFRNTSMSDLDLLSSNALNTNNEEAAKTDVDHKVPVSVGLGVSYRLNERFSLESGINYSYLRSKWKTNGLYHKTTTQKLHFLGIPLSVTYKMAEWQRIRFYASAGAMAEFNIAGKVTTDSYVDQSRLYKETNSIRMDEMFWSVNARIGANYPLWRFLSLYAEVGMSYYFDNHSKIETIHSDKPFNVDLQAGLRFNF